MSTGELVIIALQVVNLFVLLIGFDQLYYKRTK